MVWLYIAIIMVMRIVQSVFTKKAAASVPNNMIGYLKYTIYYQILAAIFALALFIMECIQGVEVFQSGKTLLYAFGSGLALAICCMCGVYALGTGTMVLNSLFGTAGLLIPTIASLFLYNESLQILQWIAIVVFLFAAYLLIGASRDTYGKFSVKTFLVLLLSLFTNGVTMLMQKMFGMNIEGGSVSLFSFASFGVGVIFMGIFLGCIFPLYKKSLATNQHVSSNEEFRFFPINDKETRLPSKLYLYGFLLAVALFIINQFATMATPLISAVVLFAMINGGATVISAIVGAIMYKEKISLKAVFGVVLGIGALILIQS